MKIAILVAMDKELSLLLHQIDNIRTVKIKDKELTAGNIGRHEVLIAKCGIGKVNAAANTLNIIREYAPDLVINTGVAGGAGSDVCIGHLLVADNVAYHDVWCGPGTVTGQADGMPLHFTSYQPVLDIAGKKISNSDIHVGLICSGDRFISTPEEVATIRKNFPEVKAVDMESAAIAHICTLENIPFNIIRVVSDTPGEGENISQYKNFWNDAPQTTFSTLTQILNLL